MRVLVERLGLSLIHHPRPPKNIFFLRFALLFFRSFSEPEPDCCYAACGPLRPPPPTQPICQTLRVCPPRFPTPSSAPQTQTVRLRSLIRPLASPRPPPPSRPTTLTRVRPASTLVDHHSTNTSQHSPLHTTPIPITYLNPPRALCVESRLDPPAHTLRHSPIAISSSHSTLLAALSLALCLDPHLRPQYLFGLEYINTTSNSTPQPSASHTRIALGVDSRHSSDSHHAFASLRPSSSALRQSPPSLSPPPYSLRS